MISDKKIVGIGCGIFKKEVEKLYSDKAINIKFKFFTSMLHMNPSALNETLTAELIKKDYKYILLYGDCCPKINNLMKENNVSKITGLNCCEIFLGKNKYKELQKRETFILFPEWVNRFEDIFFNRFGFKEDNIKGFFGDMHKRLLFIDTGVYQIDFNLLNHISELTGLKLEVEKGNLNILATGINNAIEKLTAV